MGVPLLLLVTKWKGLRLLSFSTVSSQGMQ